VKKSVLALAISTAMLSTLSACSDNDKKKSGVDAGKPIAAIEALSSECVEVQTAENSNEGVSSLSISVNDSYFSGNAFDTSAAEIVSYDSCVDQLYVVNAEEKTVDVLRMGDETQLVKAGTIDLDKAAEQAGIEIGAANSVVAKHGIVAVAVENADKQAKGLIALYRSDDLSLLNTFEAGSLPDMVTMTDNAQYIVVANEGEPSGDYKNDPEGSVTIIDLSAGVEGDAPQVSQVSFNGYDANSNELLELGVRLPRPFGASVSQDLEPEYVAITPEGKAVVSLQENNAFAIVDIASKSVESIKGLGVKRWDADAKLDYTNKDEVYAPSTVEQMVGLYMPDSITSFVVDGETYIISANEGDGREYIFESTQKACDDFGGDWDGDDFAPGGDDEDAALYMSEEDDCIAYTDEARGKDLDNVADSHPLSEASFGDGSIADKNGLGRIKVVYADTDTEIAADDDILTFGARSFSIWNMDVEQVYDSGDELAKRANTQTHFNASNDAHENDNRSDDKGVEPEAIETAVINGDVIAFVGLERHGGIAAYNVSNPEAPVFLDYLNNRDFSLDVCTAVDEDAECDNDIYNTFVGDLGPESIEYFSRQGEHFIAVGNEVSGTTTVFKLSINQ